MNVQDTLHAERRAAEVQRIRDRFALLKARVRGDSFYRSIALAIAKRNLDESALNIERYHAQTAALSAQLSAGALALRRFGNRIRA